MDPRKVKHRSKTRPCIYMAVHEGLHLYLYLDLRALYYGIRIDFSPVFCVALVSLTLASTLFYTQRLNTLRQDTIFLRDTAQKGDTKVSIDTSRQLADIFTKTLNENRFCELRRKLGIIDPFQ